MVHVLPILIFIKNWDWKKSFVNIVYNASPNAINKIIQHKKDLELKYWNAVYIM